ncbi:hypothetical protein [Desulfosporosinus fructosivorans]
MCHLLPIAIVVKRCGRDTHTERLARFDDMRPLGTPPIDRFDPPVFRGVGRGRDV